MTRHINTIFECLTHLTSLHPLLNTNDIKNVEEKLFAVAPFLWKSGGKNGFVLQAYHREDALGFCLLEKDEELGERAERNFLDIKPYNAIDFYRRNYEQDTHKGFDKIDFNAFLKLSSTDFIKLFLGAAQSRAENKNEYIY